MESKTSRLASKRGCGCSVLFVHGNVYIYVTPAPPHVGLFADEEAPGVVKQTL